MPQLEGIGVVDLIDGFPSEDPARKHDDVRRLTRDAGSAAMTFPAEHLFGRPRLKDEVWPKFLRENALRVFKLDPGT